MTPSLYDVKFVRRSSDGETSYTGIVQRFQRQYGSDNGAWFAGSSFTPRLGSVDKFQRQDDSGDGAQFAVSSFTLGLDSVDKFQRQDGSGGEAQVTGFFYSGTQLS
uniref:Uncharacterized protein n=1 Tax=Nelumbo nucifera TaxID=4432 RepID=A0A822Y1G8_NELNU|nr:TPA_asm: hypothetical protein HUJ06_026379 [Nelumbo nucifera]